MALVLQALRCDEALDARCFGIWFLALGFGLYFTANDKFADLGVCRRVLWLVMLFQRGENKSQLCLDFGDLVIVMR